MLRPVCRVLALSLGLQLTGCHKWIEIKPPELVKLNGSYSRQVGSVSTPSGTVHTREVTVAHVERPDGTLAEIKGEHDVRITSQGSTSKFDHPVNSRLHDQFLIVTSGNRSATPYVLNQVESIEVSQPNTTLTMLVAAALGIGGGLLLASVLIAE